MVAPMPSGQKTLCRRHRGTTLHARKGPNTFLHGLMLVCGEKEAVRHATVDRSMFQAVAGVVHHYFGMVTINCREVLVHNMMVSTGQEWSLQMEQGLAVWSTRQSH